MTDYPASAYISVEQGDERVRILARKLINRKLN
jgi:hypothetical protein